VIAKGRDAAALALHRFGFGPAFGSIAAIADDPRGAMLAELERPGAGRLAADLPTSGTAARAVFDFQAERQAEQKLAARAQKAAEPGGEAMAVTAKAALPDAGMRPQPPQPPPLPQQLIQKEAQARFEEALSSKFGLVERLVWFWSNHFCISADKIVAMAGPYEREAIRPHVLGRFADMLQAVESHPAMLFYLDNVQSMGPDSVAGINRDKGLNENLARETLELHTLGVRSGYSQADVTNFAKVLTGWAWIPPSEPVHGGEFAFVERMHERGDQTVLGKRYPDTGIEQGRALLADLARHPATARHVAQKLAAHFVADEPPPSLVAKLEKTFLNADGNLKEMAKSLIAADESWTPQRTKLKPPSAWLVSIARIANAQASIPIGRVLGAQAMLGEALWRPPAPNGYPDTESAWIDGIPRRLDIADDLAGKLANNVDPLALVDGALGPLASADTRETIARAESRKQALALLVMSPEFLRR
jgi:uncharacterized protein (DUF1800 family)